MAVRIAHPTYRFCVGSIIFNFRLGTEVRAGFEPAKFGFADRRLKPLGHLTWESRRGFHSQSSRLEDGFWRDFDGSNES